MTRRFRIVIELDCDGVTRKNFNQFVNAGFNTNTSLLAIDIHPWGKLTYLATDEVEDQTTLKRRYP